MNKDDKELVSRIVHDIYKLVDKARADEREKLLANEDIQQKYFKQGYEAGRADERERCVQDINNIETWTANGVIEPVIIKREVIEAIKAE